MKRIIAVLLVICLVLMPACEGPEETRGIMTKAPTGGSDVTSGPGETDPVPVTGSSGEETVAPPTDPSGNPVDPEPDTLYTSGDLVTDSLSYAVIDDDGAMWLSKDPFAHRAPASITKVLTALVVAERVDTDDDVRIQQSDFDGIDVMSSGIYPSLKPEEEMSVLELLYIMILASTNSAANILARYTAGSVEAFADLMNRKAASLGLANSHFTNPHGLDQDGHYSCAYDMAVILRAALENTLVRGILTSVSYTVAPTAYTEYRTITMGHLMVTGDYSVPGVFAGKTGSTPDAGATLLTAVKRDGKTFYICTMGSDEGYQYEDTANLISASYGLYRGTEPSFPTLVHNLAVVSEDPSGVTFSCDIDHAFTAARAVYWNSDIGTGQATFLNLDARPGRNTFRANITTPGPYVVQVFATRPDGTEAVIVQSYLFTGRRKSEELAEVGGDLYYVNANGFLKTSGVETKNGCYYAESDGRIQKGFVGGRFYAGADGKIVTGWFTDNGTRYYAQQDGRIATGHIVIDGIRRSFSEAGALLD
ncbi:MAG: serine hydrolase [Lachnospiraceae bacterium]|nr:serine hydrolase [Lachnospiraceae bacterium]